MLRVTSFCCQCVQLQYKGISYVIKYYTRVCKVYFNKNNNNVCDEKRTHLRLDSRKYNKKQ